MENLVNYQRVIEHGILSDIDNFEIDKYCQKPD